jgi:MFS family permease
VVNLLQRPGVIVGVLGSAQTLAWASSYYLPAVLATPMARDLGVSAPTVFAAFSIALVVSATVGPAAGRLIDRRGGRPVLMGTNILFAVGLLALGLAQGPITLFLAWGLIGIAMGSGLYEAAFSALVRLYGQGARNAITGITLIAGFASTVGWPLTALMESQFGWREACMGWAALHLLIGLPLNALLPTVGSAPIPVASKPPADAAAIGTASPQDAGSARPTKAASAGSAPSASSVQSAPAVHTAPAAPDSSPPSTDSAARLRLTTILLSFVFSVTFFVSAAMASHLPRLLQACGATLAAAVAAGALIGPAQVAGRLLEFGFLRRVHPLLSARLASLGHPIGALALLFAGAPAAAPFALLHGGGNGILTIAKGTLPLVLFGAHGYGERQGWLMMPARVAQASAPFVFGLALDRWGASTLWLSTALGLSALVALLLMPTIRPTAHP